ncbi:hypothetical protein [Prosthecomicrobium sp. N25]|uniref:hypothetical protein n=1 Tax=Prosthecomicrobium sp. N25 TaxID=3129254 RepID=UPI003078416C
MRTLLWMIGWFSTAVWSVVAWSAYGVFGLFTGLARSASSGDVPGFPVEPWSGAWLMDVVHGLGWSVFLVVWLGVSATILGTTWLLAAIFTRPKPRALPAGGPWPPSVPPPGPGGRTVFSDIERLSREARDGTRRNGSRPPGR